MSKKIPFLLISATIFLVFVIFSNYVARERFTQLDFDLTTKFQDHISRKFDLPFTILSLVGSAEITGIIWLTLTIFIFLKRHWMAFFALSLFWIGHIFELFGKTFVFHPAPPHLFYRGSVEFNFPSHYVQSAFSYPSGHMMRTSFLATFLFLYFYYKTGNSVKYPILAGLVVFILIMAISRIYLGEHWTSDVIGGTLLGISLGIFSAIWLLPKQTKSKEQPQPA
ncbi:MAG: phosphatase PAP2 family protein [Microgenomates group bacterium]